MTRFTRRAALPAIFLSMLIVPLTAQNLPVVKPESVGLSTERLARIREALEGRMKRQEISGAVALVARHGKVAYFETMGLADVEKNKPMRKDALFRLASMTKPISSVAVMMLHEEGKFLLDDPVSKYIPEFRDSRVAVVNGVNEPSTVPLQRPITIRNLLTHTAGLPTRNNGASKEAVTKLDEEMRAGGNIAEFTKRLAKLPMNAQPGAVWEYGPSTDVLGYLVEVLSGMSFDEFLRRRIFQPLEMTDTYFNVPANKVDRMATIYTTAHGKLEVLNPPNRSWTKETFFSGAGGLVSTAADYFRFCQMSLNGGQLNGVRLLSRKSIELMTSNQIGNLPYRPYQFGHRFGLGYRLQTDLGASGLLSSVGSYGWDGAYQTHFWVDPKEELIGILMVQIQQAPGIRQQFQLLASAAIVD
jgi:CubicO group peptidase (beta-lactamase class C family)